LLPFQYRSHNFPFLPQICSFFVSSSSSSSASSSSVSDLPIPYLYFLLHLPTSALIPEEITASLSNIDPQFFRSISNPVIKIIK